MDQVDAERVLSHLPSQEEHVKLLREMVDIRSPCGGEKEIGEFISKWFKSQGIDSFLQYPAPDRPNAIGHVGGKGAGRGKSLIFNGHTDTAMGDPDDVARLTGGRLPKELGPKSYVEDGYVGGDGAVNDKGPVSAFMMAAKALADSGVELTGEVFFTAVCGEIERAAVDEFQGPRYIGGGFGTRHLVGSGIRADYALVCEPSNFTMTSTLAGVVYLKISTHGEAMYVAEVRHKSGSSSGQPSQNAIENMLAVIRGLNSFAERYEVEGQYKGQDGNLITPTVNIGCIRAGVPYKPNYSPAVCSIYVDVRIPPYEEPTVVKKKIQQYLASQTAGEVDVEMYRSHKGYEGKGVEPLAAIVKETFKEVTNAPPAESTAVLNTRWNDVNPFNEVGIPALKFGPGRGVVRKVKIEDLVLASKLYSLIALKVCG